MANRIKHIALQTDNPAETAEWYKTVFGLDELRRSPADTGSEGVWLTDGYIYFAILKSSRKTGNHSCKRNTS
jgi:catechol 2,3-dioxygenase-like lactoylglutathione lyase family enzyme